MNIDSRESSSFCVKIKNAGSASFGGFAAAVISRLESLVHVVAIGLFLFDFSLKKAAALGFVDHFHVGAGSNGRIGPISRGAVIVAGSTQIDVGRATHHLY